MILFITYNESVHLDVVEKTNIKRIEKHINYFNKHKHGILCLCKYK
jgi:hypothetical protein